MMKGTIWCLHGAVGMADDWRGFSVPGWSVKRVDLWRFLDCCPMSMPEFGDALNEEARATEGRRVLLGYSMGGRLALHALLGDHGGGQPPARPAASRRSHLWDAAVIVSAHPGLESEREKVERRAGDAEWAAKALKGDWRGFLEEWNGQAVLEEGMRKAEGGMVMGDRAALKPRRQAVARSFMDWSLGVQGSLWERMGEIGCPLLWCVGEADGKFRELGKTLEGEWGRGRNAPSPFDLWVAEGAGHRVPWDVPEAFGKKVGEFLERADS